MFPRKNSINPTTKKGEPTKARINAIAVAGNVPVRKRMATESFLLTTESPNK
jgi:hypothetical protein